MICLLILAVVVSGCQPFTDSPPSFTLEFPDAVDLGELWLREDVNCFTCGTGEKTLGRAAGIRAISLPAAHWYVSVKLPRQVAGRLKPLAHPSLVNIGDLDLHDSDVRDDDLRHIAGINLRSINLSGTRITGAGFSYLTPHRKWIFVYLHGCAALDVNHLARFRGWTRSTISLVGYTFGQRYSDREQRLLDDARRIICDGQPESVCGVQIR